MAMPSIWCKATLVIASPQKDHFYNVFYYEPSGAPSFTGAPMTDTNTLASDIIATLGSNLPGVMTLDTTVAGINVELNNAGLVYTVSLLNPIPGTLTSDELPDNNAVVIQKRTATPGKSGRGRWFLGPVPEIETDENYRLVSTNTAYSLVAQDWVTQVPSLGTNWNPMLFSKKNNSLTILTSTFVDPKIGQIGGRKSHSLL